MRWEDCPRCGYPTKQMCKGLYKVGHPCPECGYDAVGVEEGVSDLGRHRKLKDEIKKNIIQGFSNLTGAGVPEEALVQMLARQAIGMLELPEHTTDSWYERPPLPEIKRRLRK